MKNETIGFLAYKGYTPRGIDALQRATAEIRAKSAYDKIMAKDVERSKPLSTKLRYCYLSRSGRRIIVCDRFDGKIRYIGTAANDDEAQAMKDDRRKINVAL